MTTDTTKAALADILASAQSSTGVISNRSPAQPAPQAQGVEGWEHLKQYGYAPGSYMGKCSDCQEIKHDLDKRAIRCRECAEIRACTPPSPVAQPEALPVQGDAVVFVSPEQLAALVAGTLPGCENLPPDSGVYLPARPKPGGKFTSALFAAPQPAAARVGLSPDEVDVAVVRLLKAPTYPTLAGVVPFGAELQPFCRNLAKIVVAGIASPQEDGGTHGKA